MSLLNKAAVVPRALTHRELVELLTWPDADALFAAAYEVKCREIGRFVSFRGLVDFSSLFIFSIILNLVNGFTY